MKKRLKNIFRAMTNNEELKDQEVDQPDMDQEEMETRSATAETEVEEPVDPLLKLEEEIALQKDKNLRLFAEFDNFKKRTSRQMIDLRLTAAQETIVAVLPVLDDFDRSKKGEGEQWTDGINLVYTKLYKVLETQGLTPMESTGADFDAELHEAITEIPAPTEDLKGKVIDTIEKGYFLNDKIIRYAKVVVGK